MDAPTSTDTYTTSLEEPRPLIGEAIGPATTLGDALKHSVERAPDRVQYVTGDGKEVTASEFADLAHTTARALIALDVTPRDGVAILGANSLEWFAADVGSTLAGAIPTGVYVTNHDDVCEHILTNASVTIAFAASQRDVTKLLGILPRCERLRTVVYWGSDVDIDRLPDHRDVLLSWEDFTAMGTEDYAEELERRLSDAKPEDCCKLIYTSGTTGMPKAVMISHGNFAAAVQCVESALNVTGDDVLVSYLPCSHIAANAIDIMGPILTDMRVHIAPSDALRGGNLVKTLCRVRPTIFLAVPRVWEKMREKMIAIGSERNVVSRYVAGYAKSIGSAASDAEDAGTAMPYGATLCDRYIFSSVRSALGLDRARLLFNSTAPMQEVTDDYFRSLRIRIYDLFGASEATGPLTCNLPEAFKRSTSGRPLPGVEAKIINPVAEGEGELCFRGRNIFMGYLGNPEDSRKSIDDEGFFRTGDLGKIDDDGFVTITGRIKELIITAGGENVAPLLLENAILKALPGIARVFAVGDKRKFISCLLIPYIDDDGNLTGMSKDVNPSLTTPKEAIDDETWKKVVDKGIKEANKGAISNAATVKKWRLLDRDFSVEKDELTPSLKVKRKVVMKHFSEEIEEIYNT